MTTALRAPKPNFRVAILLLSILGLSPACAPAAEKPNVTFILADDAE